MKVLFLCGGAGKRMFPITEDKVTLKFLGKTLLEHQIDCACQAGLGEFIFVGNPTNIADIKQITSHISGVKADFVVQKKPAGIANAIQIARPLLKSEVIIVNPNDIFATSAYALLLKQRAKTISILLGYEVKEYFPGGYLRVDERNILQGIIEKPEPGNEPSDLVTMLIHLHRDPEILLQYIEKEPAGNDDVYERAVNALAIATGNVNVIKYTGKWTAIKYPWHILDAVKHFLDDAKSYVSPTASISDRATIDGKVIIEDNVRVLENTVIRGPVYIGKNSVIGNNCLVRSYSHIGADCTVGFGTEIKGSYLGDGCWTHKNYLGDSVIGEGCSFGANTVTANWRFDEKSVKVDVQGITVDTGLTKLGAIIGNHCKTGVNVSLMPGVKIAPGSLIAPGKCVMEDIV